MQRSYKAEGIVIKRTNFGEADKLITIFSKYHGKIVAFAKGIRKINSRKAPHLELFTHCLVFISHGKNLDIITESQTITSFKILRKDLFRLTSGFGILEVLERLLPEREPHRDIYELFLTKLNLIDREETTNFQDIKNQFIHEILWRLGYLPQENTLSADALKIFLEEVMEKKVKSESLLTKLSARL